MRPAYGIIVLMAAICAHAALSKPTDTSHPLSCESKAPEFADERVVTCRFPSSGITQRAAFRALFLGSHDDTQLSMTPKLNDVPLTCDKGSKTSSRFEDGEITLECRFPVQAPANSIQVLQMRIEWTHAQYSDFEFTVN